MSNFAFKSNQKYMDFKMNQKNKLIFFNPNQMYPFVNIMGNEEENMENKSLFSNETLATEKDKSYIQTNTNFPNSNKNFFNDLNLSKNSNINVKSFLFNFSKN